MHENLMLVDPEAGRKLVGIFNGFSKKLDFPTDWCGYVSRAVSKQLGYKLHLKGGFLLDRPRLNNIDPLNRGPFMAWWHVFCEDTNRNVIDLTAQQFRPWLNTPLPEGVLIIPPDSKLYKRYLINWNSETAHYTFLNT